VKFNSISVDQRHSEQQGSILANKQTCSDKKDSFRHTLIKVKRHNIFFS